MNTLRTLSLTLVLLFALAACAQPPPTPASAWPTRLVLAQAEQTDAPALTVHDGRVWAAWIGADAGGVHQDAGWLDAAGAGQPVVLPLPPTHPFAQQLFPARDGNVHLLWLDADANGNTQLYSTLLSGTLAVLRGPTPLTENGAWRYAAHADDSGVLWMVSSGGIVSEPSLTVRRVDAQGRPRIEEQPAVAADADWPALRPAADGTLWLYWLSVSENRVWAVALVEGQTRAAHDITEAPALNAGDHLESFRVGQDGTQQYVFWNLTRANNERESWWTHGALTAGTLPLPERLRVEAASTSPFATGFAGEQAEAAQIGGSPVAWVMPLDAPAPLLPAAALLPDGQLGLLYFRDGALVGMQTLGARPVLLGMPVLTADANGHLYLTTAEAGAETAALTLYSTRTFPIQTPAP